VGTEPAGAPRERALDGRTGGWARLRPPPGDSGPEHSRRSEPMSTTRYDTADAIRADLTEEAREALDTLQETAAAADLSTDVVDGRTACALSGPEHRSRAAAAARERLSTWRSVS